MGLDILAYRQVTLLHEGECDEDHGAGVARTYPHPQFLDHADEMVQGCYSFVSCMDFRAGSYGGYNQWRAQLSMMAHGVQPEVIWRAPEAFNAFVELINFADNEGTIGSHTAAKLAKDFHQFSVQATEIGGWFEEKYKDWSRAFSLASDGGFVVFH